jgi:phosphate starvation-inducible PhoH-like protein
MKMRGTLEIAPLAFMRGRTFDDSFIIADEMQNSTINQMKMILTRIGYNSKMVVTGDTEQSDLKDEMSGLVDFLEKLKLRETQFVEDVHLSEEDINRHPVVKEILELYNV